MKSCIFYALAASTLIACNNEQSASDSTQQAADNDSIASVSPVNTLIDGKLTTPPKDTVYGLHGKSNMPMKEMEAIPPLDTANIAKAYTMLEAAPIAINQSDDEIAWSGVSWAWGNTGPCTRAWLCLTYIGNFEITFGDGNLGFAQVVHRWGNSAHDCIQNAKNAMKPPHPDRGLAVAWVMASQIHNRPYYEWLRTHGDAVLHALARIPG